MVTQMDVAQAIGMDVSTVNKILNKKPGPVFTKRTIRLVFDTARRLGYRLPTTSRGALLRILHDVFPGNLPDVELARIRSLPVDYVSRVRDLIGRS